MNHFSEMEWNWENLVAFGSKAIETEKKLQFTDWMIVDDGEMDAGSFNISAGGGASGSDGGHVSSAKSSISASTDSSTKDGMQTPNFRLMSFDGCSGNFNNNNNKPGLKGGEILKDGSIGSAEPLIGLKLGKRTYFENSSVKGASCSVMPTPSTTNLIKKTKSSGQNAAPSPRCVVEGCNVDLSSAKEYHRKHRVCDTHSKSPKVFVGGVERRFCQQCSRFHSLAEFDEKKRSCRRRLSDHNARRRKPPQETIQFNSTRLSTPFYEGRGFVLNNAAYMYSRNTGNGGVPWNSSCNSKFTITKGYPPKPDVDGSTTDGLMHMPGIKLPHFIHTQDNDNPTNGFLAAAAPKNSSTDALNPVSKGSAMISSANVDAAPDYRRALSLLSSNSWGSELSVPVYHPLHENSVYVTQPSMPPEGVVPLSPSDLWLTGNQSSTHHHPRTLANNGNNFQEIQLFKTPYETDFYSNIL